MKPVFQDAQKQREYEYLRRTFKESHKKVMRRMKRIYKEMGYTL